MKSLHDSEKETERDSTTWITRNEGENTYADSVLFMADQVLS